MKVPRVAKRDPPAKTPARNFEAEDRRRHRHGGVEGFETIGATGAGLGGWKWPKPSRDTTRAFGRVYRNISADSAFTSEPPGKNPPMRHVNVCSACGKPQSVASVTCLWCGQPKKLFSGRLVAIWKAVLSGIAFLVKRARTDAGH